MVVLGKVTDPYGVHGWVRIHPFGDDPVAWTRMPVWWLSSEGLADWREAKPKTCRLHGEGLICQFEGIEDRTAAEALKGMLVGAPREALPATAENEFYWADLIGLEVVNGAGEVLGRVEELIETGAHTVLRLVSKEGKERLLPFVASVVLAVERDNGLIRVDWSTDW